MKSRQYIALLLLTFSSNTWALEYYCKAVDKYDFGIKYGGEAMHGGQFATKVEELEGVTYLSRCSMSYIPDIPEITCDRYVVDRVEYDKKAKIKKYYVFSSQFDFQIFPDMGSLENNGRGSVQYGKCKIVSP